MKIRFTFTAIVLSLSLFSFGQKTQFAQLVGKMYFNVFERNPDTQIQPFIQKYFPAFLKWSKDENAGWAYTLKSTEFANVDTTAHSFIFTNHPVVRTKFIKGHFDFETYESKKEKPLISNWSLYFCFDNYNDAIVCFDSIYKIFEPLSKDKVNFTRNNRRIAQLTNNSKISDTNCVELVLVDDDLLEDRYKVYFQYGRHYQND
ncbi:MAG: hypothetical protein EOP53_26465 [Sphingobacteriales bacterium]|nr:MAG: hypothetical protein EOP53_26465 [Sphingobacteriales bacterium]